MPEFQRDWAPGAIVDGRITRHWYTYRTAGWEWVSPHVNMPSWWETVDTEIDDGLVVDLRAEWSAEAFGYDVKQVTVRREEGSVTATDLRQVSLTQLVARTSRFIAGLHATVIDDDGEEQGAQELLDALRDNTFAGRRPTPEVLQQVAILYEVSSVLGANPVQEIERLFALPPRTATHWVKLARDRGHLDERIMKKRERG